MSLKLSGSFFKVVSYFQKSFLVSNETNSEEQFKTLSHRWNKNFSDEN